MRKATYFEIYQPDYNLSGQSNVCQLAFEYEEQPDWTGILTGETNKGASIVHFFFIIDQTQMKALEAKHLDS